MGVTDQLAVELYGMTRQQAHDKRVCIKCGLAVPRIDSALATRDDIINEREYRISAVCGPCFDKLFQEDD